MLIDQQYYITEEYKRAAAALGLNITSVLYNPGEDITKEIINAALDIEADYILTINHWGVTGNRKLIQLLDLLNIPLASWFVDSPRFTLQGKNLSIPAKCGIFLWDPSYEPYLRKSGYENLEYLPLATEIKEIPEPLQEREYRSRIVFVGHTMIIKIAEFESILDPTPEERKLLLKIHDYVLLSETDVDLERLCTEAFPTASELRRAQLEMLLVYQWTSTMRIAMARAMSHFDLKIYGDSYWKEFIPENCYGGYPKPGFFLDSGHQPKTKRIYAGADINLNQTSKQMKLGDNQRIFDVPACGSYIITDYTGNCEKLFSKANVPARFKNLEELSDLVSTLLGKREETAERALKMREEVLNKHTYVHRLDTIDRKMRDWFSD